MTAITVPLSRIEPVRIEEKIKIELAEASLALANASDRLGADLPPETLAQVAAMIRIINSYYSNRIEGNNTYPREIEAALAGTLDKDPCRRALQREAAADVQLQVEIDHRAAWGQLEDPTHPDFIRRMHRELYRDVDTTVPVIRRTTAGDEEIVVRPGNWRDGDIEARDHLSLPHDRVPAFMDHFHARLCQNELHGQTAKILAMATAHHRMNFIRPFHYGNGRVGRLMSHAMAHHAGIGADGLWSVSRGLARGLEGGVSGREEYREMMQLADQVREVDQEGCGDLSLDALTHYAYWFLSVCLDQVNFMADLLNLSAMKNRLTHFAEAQNFRTGGAELLRVVLIRGQVERGNVATILNVAPRTARAVIRELTDAGILGSDTPRSALELRFPSQTHDMLFPNFFEG